MCNGHPGIKSEVKVFNSRASFRVRVNAVHDLHGICESLQSNIGHWDASLSVATASQCNKRYSLWAFVDT